MKFALTSLRHALYASLVGWLAGCGVLLLVCLIGGLGLLVLDPAKLANGASLSKGLAATTGLLLIYGAYSGVVVLAAGLLMVWPACCVPRSWPITRAGWAALLGGVLGYLVGLTALGPVRGASLSLIPALYGAAIGFIVVRTKDHFPLPPTHS